MSFINEKTSHRKPPASLNQTKKQQWSSYDTEKDIESVNGGTHYSSLIKRTWMPGVKAELAYNAMF